MSPVILNLIAAPSRSPAIKGADPALDPDGPSKEFGNLLAGKLQAAPVKTARVVLPATVPPAASLSAKIEKLLRGGVSQTEIIAKLAATLAATIAAKLGDPSTQTRQQLHAVFARALAPPAHAGNAQTLAQSARALAQRFKKIEELAAAVAADPGQRNQLVGTFLDAGSAKETPVPASTATLDSIPVAPNAASGLTDKPAAAAFAASAAAALPAHTAALDSPATAAALSPEAGGMPEGTGGFELAAVANGVTPSAQGDGRRVTIDATAAIGANGDTALGRVLTRASLAADARQAVTFAVATAARTSALSPGVAKPSLSETAAAAFVKAFELAVSAERESGQALNPAVAPSAAAIPAVVPFRIEPVNPAASSAPAAHVPSADQSAIADQVLHGIVMRSTGASSEMRLSLKPETLGDVNIKLTVTAGTVTAHVLADTPEVRDALVAAQPQLTKSLADAGLKLDGLTVDLSGNGFAGFAGRDGEQAPARDGERRATYVADDDLDTATLDAIPSFAPSSKGAGDYNYLA